MPLPSLQLAHVAIPQSAAVQAPALVGVGLGVRAYVVRPAASARKFRAHVGQGWDNVATIVRRVRRVRIPSVRLQRSASPWQLLGVVEASAIHTEYVAIGCEASVLLHTRLSSAPSTATSDLIKA